MTTDFDIFLQHYVYKELLDVELIKVQFDKIIDAGAYTGITCRVFNELFPSAEIHAIEPESSNQSQFIHNCNNLLQDGVVKLYRGILFYRDNFTEQLFLDNAGAHWSYKVSKAGEQFIDNTSVYSLKDFYFPDLKVLYKIDIEGSEREVMHDPKFRLILKNCWVLIELHDGQAYLDYFSLLAECGIRNVRKVGEYWLTCPAFS